MKTKIYLVRHGESEGNKKQLVIGHTDVDLTEKGRMQAEKTAEYLKNIHADKIYSSDLKRACETAKCTAKIQNLSIIKDKRLREMDCGKWENRSMAEIKELYPENYRLWYENIGRVYCNGGESAEKARERLVEALTDIAEKNVGKTLFFFSHAVAIRLAVSAFLGMELDEIKNLPWPPNASVTTLEYENGKFKVIEYGYDKHMGDISTTVDF